MNIGILTGGGDCPGLNAVIRAVVRKAITTYKYEVTGIFEGWRGLLVDGLTEKLDLEKVTGILQRGGTILRTSRTNPFKQTDGVDQVKSHLEKYGIDVLIAVGGEDTLGVAEKLSREGIKIVGIPKTIDNDLCGTDYTFGFDTALNTAMEAIDRVQATAESHNRVMVVEVMGRHTGWIAVEAGIAGGADVILAPEFPLSIQQVCNILSQRHARGRNFSIVVVSEGAKIIWEEGQEPAVTVQDLPLDAFGHVRLGGVGHRIAKEIEKRTGYETRVVILGYIQRGGTPTAFDRVLGTRFGLYSVDMVARKEFGMMASLQGNQLKSVTLSEAVKQLKTVDRSLYEAAEAFFG